MLLLSRLGLYATLDSVFTQYWNIYSLKINKGSSVHYYVGQIYINIPHRNKTELFYRLSCVWIETSLTNSRSNYLRSWSSELCYFWATKLGGRTWTPPSLCFFFMNNLACWLRRVMYVFLLKTVNCIVSVCLHVDWSKANTCTVYTVQHDTFKGKAPLFTAGAVSNHGALTSLAEPAAEETVLSLEVGILTWKGNYFIYYFLY